jgi:hypothetical protein
MLVEAKNSWERNYVLEKKGLEESGKVRGISGRQDKRMLVEGKNYWHRGRLLIG